MLPQAANGRLVADKLESRPPHFVRLLPMPTQLPGIDPNETMASGSFWGTHPDRRPGGHLSVVF